eukprot:jgi/Mesvir1/13705/Mv06935-RA.1
MAGTGILDGTMAAAGSGKYMNVKVGQAVVLTEEQHKAFQETGVMPTTADGGASPIPLDLALTWEKELSESEWRLQKKAKNRDRDFNDSLIGAQPRRAILNYDRVKEVIPSEVRSALIDRDVQRMLHIRKLLAEWMTRQAELQERTTRDDGSRLTSSTRSALRKQLRDLEIVIKENMGRVLVNKMSKRMDVLDSKIEEIQARIVRERKKPNPDRASLERMRQRQEKLFAEEQAEVARQQAMWEALPPAHLANPAAAVYAPLALSASRARDQERDVQQAVSTLQGSGDLVPLRNQQMMRMISPELGLAGARPRAPERAREGIRRSGRTQHVPGEMFDFEEAEKKAERKAAKKKGSDGAGPSHQVKARRYRKRRAATRR